MTYSLNWEIKHFILIVKIITLNFFRQYDLKVGYNDGHQRTIAMNGEIPSVPITTLAGISSLTDCKY